MKSIADLGLPPKPLLFNDNLSPSFFAFWVTICVHLMNRKNGKGRTLGGQERNLSSIGQGLIDNDIEVTYMGLRREGNGLWSL